MKKTHFKKISIVLALTMLLSMFSGMTLVSQAAPAGDAVDAFDAITDTVKSARIGRDGCTELGSLFDDAQRLEGQELTEDGYLFGVWEDTRVWFSGGLAKGVSYKVTALVKATAGKNFSFGVQTATTEFSGSGYAGGFVGTGDWQLVEVTGEYITSSAFLEILVGGSGAEVYWSGIAIQEIAGEVVPTEAPEATFAEVTSANAALNGTWYVKSFSGFSEGNAIRSDRDGDTMEFAFSGRILEINAYKSPSQGSIAVSIDGGEETIVSLTGDTYDTVMEVVYSNANLTDEDHIATIRVIGATTQIDGVTTNAMVTIDTVGTESGTVAAVELKAVTYQAEAVEGWNVFNHFQFNGKSAVKSTNAAAEAQKFIETAKTVKIFSYKSPTQGTITVKITAGGQEYIEDVVLTSDAAVDSDFGEVFSKTFDTEQEIKVEITNAGGSVYVDYVEFVK